jgi:nucleotide-binding universal stress UspA family protein
MATLVITVIVLGICAIAQVILGYAIESRSDLPVFGAYSHARLKQRLFGGTTRTLLAQMPVPVLVSR